MSTPTVERRTRVERRRSVFRSLWHGNFARRRHAPRRSGERHAAVTDWFQAHWLAVAISVLLLSVADAFLTVTLISHGAVEVNPLMDPLVRGSGPGFAFWKIGLTAFGVIVLTVLGRLRVWGGTVGSILYLALAGYAALVVYELFLLRNIPLD
jgi:uncharacterized protein DUF5658